MNIGENIKKLRTDAGLTQEELASKISVSPKTISSWETNRNLPDINSLIVLSEALGVSINDIMDIESNGSKEVSNIYEKKNFKDNLLKVIFIGIIFIVPIFYFWHANTVTVSAFAARLYAFEGELTIPEIAQSIAASYSMFIWDYIIYLILMLVNYILYNKKKFKALLVVNILIILFVIFKYITYEIAYEYDYLLYLVPAVIGLVWAVLLKKRLN